MKKGKIVGKEDKRSRVQEPPDGGWGWLIVIGGMYSLAMWGAAARCYSVFYGPMMSEFNVEYSQVSWLNGMFQISYGLASESTLHHLNNSNNL